MTANDPTRVLVIDDEESMRFFLERTLARSGYAVETAPDGEAGVEAARQHRPHVVVTDLKMPGIDGLEVLARIKAIDPTTAVVVVTAYATIDTAVNAMKHGAADYLTKPFDAKTIRAVVARVVPDAPAVEPELIGDSEPIRAIRDTVERLATSDATVLLRGESGTGKELVARLLHHVSPRATEPFVAVNCAALPPTLIEAELFGHVEGAFTGATRGRSGLAARAGGGTLFLDEIGDIPLPVQTKLLRVLQERAFTPIGGSDPIPLDARIVSATHRDLPALVEAGDFREDLYYRLNVVPIEVPPLRARTEDIPTLVAHFLARRDPAPALTDAALDKLRSYAWPGNVRELANLVERLAATRAGETVDVADLPPELDRPAPSTATPSVEQPFDDARRTFERDYFSRLLEATDGNISEAARRAGISRPNLYRRLDELGIRD